VAQTHPTRGPKPALSLERIADTAIGIADAEGLAAVSMQRVATELGFTKLLREHGDRFLALAATMTSAATEGPQEQAFTFGLDRVLDGLQLLIAQRGMPATDGQLDHPPTGHCSSSLTEPSALSVKTGGQPHRRPKLHGMQVLMSDRMSCAASSS
jgi:hypothetical protein